MIFYRKFINVRKLALQTITKKLLTTLLIVLCCISAEIVSATTRSKQQYELRGGITSSDERASEFSINWFTIDSGGGRSSNNEFQLHGTVGQTDVVVMIGEDFTLKGGFWPDPDLTNQDFVLFKDSFEDIL